MFERLQKKWKVGGTQLLLILCTFAIGGSLTGYVGRKLLNLLPLEEGVLWIILYIIVVTLIWPFAVLLISFFFGQYRFFVGYLRKMGVRMRLIKSTDPAELNEANANDSLNIKRIAIFASGAGSNAARIIDHFRDDPRVRVVLIASNKPEAGVWEIARKEQLPTLLIEKETFFRGHGYVPQLQSARVDLVVLAGFLWKVPATLIEAFPNRIINIHPALLPKYGGKGMYGANVHAAVIAAGETESGITIHHVDGHYDNGDIIFQAKCRVLPDDTAETLAARIHHLEHEHYPNIIERLLVSISRQG